MKQIINGVSTHYQVIGNASRTLVLLHGWGCDWQIWAPIIPELSKTHTLVIPDLPAFGQSATPTDVWDSATYATWLRAFLRQVVGNRAFALAGHSFGGKVGAFLAARPDTLTEQFQKLIIIDASGLPLPLTAKEQFVQTASQFLPAFLKKLLSKNVKSSLLKRVGVAHDYQQANDYQQQVLKKIVRENIAEILTQIRMPTLVIWGTHDETTPLHKGKEFASSIPQAHLVTMKNSGHYPFLDETQLFIKEVRAFYD